MKLRETVACQARYGNIVECIWGDYDVVWAAGENDYQGSVAFVVKHQEYEWRTPKYTFYSYSYGSCPVCDSWEAEGLNDEEIMARMLDEAVTFTGMEALRKWYNGYGKEDSPYLGWHSEETKNFHEAMQAEFADNNVVVTYDENEPDADEVLAPKWEGEQS